MMGKSGTEISGGMTMSVIVPTYLRPKDLERCLDALMVQERPADEIVVVFRYNDDASRAVLAAEKLKAITVVPVEVRVPGQLAANNAGIDAARGDIIAFCDDDAAPHRDWLRRIEAWFLSDSKIGGVGGRDFVFEHGKLLTGSARVVGRIQWFGRAIGNHHIGSGSAQAVDTLKGVNMAYRRAAVQDVRFDSRLKGDGAQVHMELGFCLKIKGAGWKLIYDPAVAVDHFPAVRHDRDQRYKWDAVAATNAIHNETFPLLEYFSMARRCVFFLWSFVIGTRGAPGLLQVFRLWLKGVPNAHAQMIACLRGRYLGWRTWRETSPPR